MEEENLYISTSKIGGINFQIIATKKGIKQLHFKNKNEKTKHDKIIKLQPDDPYMFGIFTQLEEYFNRKRKVFNIPLDIEGTDFQKKVWNELLNIPYGKTISYKQLSKRLGNPKLLRAVGKANSTNPVAVVIPCHRVINSNGDLGGYAGGLEIKEKLLELEGSLSMELFN